MSKKITLRSINELHRAAKEFLEIIGNARLIAFHGQMGAGKTTFIKAVCQELGVKDAINSPTFAIVNEYYSEKLDNFVYHFDFYRINRIEEALDFGCNDYFCSGNYCLMEWPENVQEILPEETLNVYIDIEPDNTRIIHFD